MVGKNVGVRLNKEELEHMQKIADKEDTSVGKLVKKAMKTMYFDKSVELVPTAEVSEQMKEKMKISKESEHWKTAMATLLQTFELLNGRFTMDPEFIQWMGTMNDVSIYEYNGLWDQPATYHHYSIGIQPLK